MGVRVKTMYPSKSSKFGGVFTLTTIINCRINVIDANILCQFLDQQI